MHNAFSCVQIEQNRVRKVRIERIVGEKKP